MKQNTIKDFFNEKAERWDQITNHNPQKIKFLLEKIKISSGNIVLDVGTGTGILIPFLLELVGHEGQIIAVDLSEKMIELAQKKYPKQNVNFVVGDVNNLILDEIRYDAVICYSVFPHFLSPEETLLNLWKLLKPEGQIIVCHSESKDTINHRHQSVGAQEISLGLPESKEVEKLFVKAGFKVLDSVDNEELYYVIGKKRMDVKNKG